MNPNNLRRISATIRLAGELTEQHANTVLHNLEQWSARGFPTGVGGSGQIPTQTSDPSDPTFNAVLHPDSHATDRAQLTEAIKAAATAAATINDIISRAIHREKPSGRENTVSTCANLNGCEDIAVKAGRCDPCYTYRHRHGRDAPRSVLDSRNQKRKAKA